MDMLRNAIECARAHTTRQNYSRLTLGLALVAALIAASTASASLIGSTYSLRLEGQVKIGAAISTEGYAATPVFNATQEDVPNTIAPAPIPPFSAGQSLRVTETEAAKHVIVWVTGHNGGPTTFINPLDPNSLVEFETIFTFPGVNPGEMVTPSNIEIENFGDFYNPVTTQVTGLGTVANPLKILLQLNPDDVLQTGTSHLKLHFDYDEGNVPEPATLALVSLGLVGLAGLRRRRS
jgi:hypothetical protein